MRKGLRRLAVLGVATSMAVLSASTAMARVVPAKCLEAGSKRLSAAAETEAPQAAAPKEAAGYVFQSGGVVIPMGVDASGILAALGTASKTFERESCAYQGLNKVYTYSGFELSTYPVGEKDYVESVYIFDASVSTPEGIRIGSTKQDVLAAYGSAYNADEAAFGTYTYTAGNAQLKVYTTNDVVDAIEYLVIPEA